MKKVLAIALVSAALPLSANAALSTWNNIVDTSAGKGQAWATSINPGNPNGTFGNANEVANLTMTMLVNTLTASANLDAALENSITLNGTFSSSPFAGGTGAPPQADLSWTFTNAKYAIVPGPLDPDNVNSTGFLPDFTTVSTVYTDPTTGQTNDTGTVIDFATQDLATLAPLFQSTSALQLVSGSVTCQNAFAQPCPAGLDGTVWDAFYFQYRADASQGFAIVESDIRLLMISDSGNTAYGLVGTLVPVPAAVWLFGSALGLLGWVRRRAA